MTTQNNEYSYFIENGYIMLGNCLKNVMYWNKYFNWVFSLNKTISQHLVYVIYKGIKSNKRWTLYFLEGRIYQVKNS